jgi:hypothetical protein
MNPNHRQHYHHEIAMENFECINLVQDRGNRKALKLESLRFIPLCIDEDSI